MENPNESDVPSGLDRPSSEEQLLSGAGKASQALEPDYRLPGEVGLDADARELLNEERSEGSEETARQSASDAAGSLAGPVVARVGEAGPTSAPARMPSGSGGMRMEVDDVELIPDYSQLPEHPAVPSSWTGRVAPSHEATGCGSGPLDSLSGMLQGLLAEQLAPVIQNQRLLAERLERIESSRGSMSQDSVRAEPRLTAAPPGIFPSDAGLGSGVMGACGGAMGFGTAASGFEGGLSAEMVAELNRQQFLTQSNPIGSTGRADVGAVGKLCLQDLWKPKLTEAKAGVWLRGKVVQARVRYGDRLSMEVSERAEDVRVSVSELPKLEIKEHERDLAPLLSGDWLAMISPAMKDISSTRSIWWSQVVDAATSYYQHWLMCDPVARLSLQPPQPYRFEHTKYARVEQRALTMLLRAVPTVIKEELVANRKLSCIELLALIHTTYQPGGVDMMVSKAFALYPAKVVELVRFVQGELETLVASGTVRSKTKPDGDADAGKRLRIAKVEDGRASENQKGKGKGSETIAKASAQVDKVQADDELWIKQLFVSMAAQDPYELFGKAFSTSVHEVVKARYFLAANLSVPFDVHVAGSEKPVADKPDEPAPSASEEPAEWEQAGDYEEPDADHKQVGELLPEEGVDEDNYLSKVQMVNIPFGIPLKNKGAQEVLRALKLIDARASCLGIKIARLHSDKGSEFDNRFVRDWAASRGIWKSSTGGDNWRSNGTAEALVGILKVFVHRRTWHLKKDADKVAPKDSWTTVAVLNQFADDDFADDAVRHAVIRKILELEHTSCAKVERYYDLWKDALEKELHSMTHEKQALKVISEEELTKYQEAGTRAMIIPSKLVCTRKSGGRFKARLVACGNYVDLGGKDGENRSASVDLYAGGIDAAVLRQVLALAVKKGWSAGSTDVSTAFLNAELLDRMACCPRSLMIVQRAVYGLDQSPRDWGICRDKDLRTIRLMLGTCEYRLVMSDVDNNLWFLTTGRKSDPVVACLMVYVDDLLATGPLAVIRPLLDEISKLWQCGTVSFLPEDTSEVPLVFFGYEIRRVGRSFHLSQRDYVKELACYEAMSKNAAVVRRLVEARERAEVLQGMLNMPPLVPIVLHPHWPAPPQLTVRELRTMASAWGGPASSLYQEPHPAYHGDQYIYVPEVRPRVLVRWHMRPRVRLFNPERTAAPIPLGALTGERRTLQGFANGDRVIWDDRFTNPDRGRRHENQLWRGRTELEVDPDELARLQGRNEDSGEL
ncbi:Copia protein [Symbiodinium microadriaticum]|uniref:Copia protein n=1 Tax=Symbiodinium microadriaticum TaxID=2951 RepID=A0A1Q9F0Z9_SYMMI|nr:Copia protein [Symbiodinium microadriaticum]